MTIKFKLDNEFELVFVVSYNQLSSLSYNGLLSDVRQKFRDMYKNVLLNKQILYQYGQESFRHFESEFLCIRDDLMRSNVQSTGIPKKPRTFQESVKSQKTIDSMIISRPGDGKKAKKVEEAPKKVIAEEVVVASTDSGSDVGSTPGSPSDEIAKRREVLLRKMNAKKPAAAKYNTRDRAEEERENKHVFGNSPGDVKNNTNLDYSGEKDKENSNARGDEDLAFISE
ncbi:hypothetical protein OSTOST_24306, partial [Ostertagia ostertagi]